MALPTLFVRWKALDPAVNTVAVVIDSEGGKLSFKIELTPKQHLVEQILPNRSDDALDEGMRPWLEGHCLDFLDVQNA